MRIDHLTAVVPDADAAAAALHRLLDAERVGSVDLAGMRISTLRIGGVELHLNAPTGEGPVQNHFAQHGASLHHLAFAVDDLDTTLGLLRSRGFATLGPPVEAAPGLREVFVDPRTTGGVLIQLVQRTGSVTPQDLHGSAVETLVHNV